MENKTLYILRSVSGAGKTTLAKVLESSLPDAMAIAADDFWYLIGNGQYSFDISRLGEAHKWCQERVMYLMDYEERTNIILHNTNTSEKEITPYIEYANKFNYKVVSLVVENRHGNNNVHNVPTNVLEKQQCRLCNNLKLL